ncbi:uncharacterized protein A4U43_C03F12400 [Asparagus officinalis]|uniref:Uncharacterized protein n=1 Tax=Asparagus officinalis TaxID=4686 RepID=A0A5P1FB88_ASPOF|nr:uncharacterized protein A4U43_C03F12400 [Asparagus officinalis]
MRSRHSGSINDDVRSTKCNRESTTEEKLVKANPFYSEDRAKSSKHIDDDIDDDRHKRSIISEPNNLKEDGST